MNAKVLEVFQAKVNIVATFEITIKIEINEQVLQALVTIIYLVRNVINNN